MTLRSPHSTQQNHSTIRGQGALEYLLLIGGAVLIATIVLLVIVGSSQSTNTIISNNLSTSDVKVQNAFNTASAGLGGGGGGPAAVCGDNTITPPELCDGTASFAATCSTQNFDTGTLACNPTCNGYNTSACSNIPTAAFSGISIIQTPGTNNFNFQYTLPGDLGSTGNPLAAYAILWIQERTVGGLSLCNNFNAIPAPLPDPYTISLEIWGNNYATSAAAPLSFSAANSGVVQAHGVPAGGPVLGATPLPIGNGNTTHSYALNLPTGAPFTGIQECFVIVGGDDDPSPTPIYVSPVFALV